MGLKLCVYCGKDSGNGDGVAVCRACEKKLPRTIYCAFCQRRVEEPHSCGDMVTKGAGVIENRHSYSDYKPRCSDVQGYRKAAKRGAE